MAQAESGRDPLAPARGKRAPQSVLFACGMNAIRSPMAARLMRMLFPRGIYVASAGVRAGTTDPFAQAVMEEVGLDLADHCPMTFEQLDDWEGLNFDLIVTLSPEAHHKALDLTRTIAADVEYWPIPDPAGVEGSREQRLDAYRQARDMITDRIRARFGGIRPAGG